MNKRLLYRAMLCILVLIFVTSAAIGCASQQPQPATPTPEPSPAPTEPKPTEQPVETPPPPKEEEKDISLYMPMKVGYIWQYEGEGNEYASYTLRVEFQEGDKYQLTRDNGGTVIADIYQIRKDSIVHVYQSGENYSHKNMLNQKENLEDTIIKLPIKVGNKWVGEENSYEIIDTKATITVPYGTFKDCLVIKRTYKDGSEDYMHYKEGVGLLQSEFRSGDFKIFSRLKSFSNK